VAEGDGLTGTEMTPRANHTPPARYTEPSLARPWRSWASAGRRPTPPLQNIEEPRATLGRGRRARPSWVAFAWSGYGVLLHRWSTTIHRLDGGRPRRDRVRLRPGVDWLTRFYFGSDARAGGRHRPGRWPQAHVGRDGWPRSMPRGGSTRSPLFDDVVVRVGATGPTCQRVATTVRGPRCPTTWPPTS